MGNTLTFRKLLAGLAESTIKIIVVRLVIQGRGQKGMQHWIRGGLQGFEDPRNDRQITFGQIIDNSV